jgi:hypothetical protein
MTPLPDKMPTDCPKKAMDFIIRSFREHPALMRETYLQHLWFTTCMSARLLLSAATLFIHGFLPFLFVSTTSEHSKTIRAIFAEREQRKMKQP